MELSLNNLNNFFEIIQASYLGCLSEFSLKLLVFFLVHHPEQFIHQLS